ncbi:KxYKxGKxW signal peptide domain-containing protein, partial [Ligilactobacillus murinus]|uniref:KxYKxGKxW signal peptide domain-containing protein n=1 Tax=Ligilactobacillus murinus TaxID=1622 RepID=UPI00214B2B41
MKRYKYDQLRRAQEKKLYYKMYKAGKNWIIAGLTMVGFSFMFSMAAKADVDEQRPNTENLDIQAEKEQQNIAQVTSTDTNEQLVVTETPTTSNNEPKENEATPAKVETGENTVESAKQPEPQVATNEVVASRAEDTTPVIRRARTVASTTAVTEDDIDQKTVRTENMIDWLQDGLFSGDNKNALTTPILPNDQNGKRNNQAPFDINSAAMSQLSYNTLYYPFVKKLQAAYKAEDYKELTNMAAILQAIYGKVNTEQLITGIFTPEDNYKADQALANAKLNRSVAVIVSMDQDGHILSQSVGLPDSFVTGSGSGYKVEDGSLEDTGYISWPSAILDIVVGKNGTDMISYDPARAATIPNDPPKTLGVYKYIGSEYYHSTVNQDLIKYADNDPMKTKFAVADYSANKKKIIPEGHALTYIINRYQTQVAPVDKTAQTTITYKGNKGNVLTVPAGSQVKLSGKEGQEVEIPTPPTIKDYTFNFPRFNGQRTSIGSKVTLEKSNELIYFYIADPMPAKVTVAYKSGDTVLTPATPVQLTGNIDDEVSVPSPPTISGYTFNNVLLNGEASSIGATVTLAENNTLVYNYRKDAANAVTEVVYQNVNGESQTAVLGKIDTRSIPKKAGLKYTITDGPEAVIPGKGIQPAMKILFNGQEVTKGQVVTLLEKNTLTYIFPARTTTPTQKPAVTTVSYKAGTETLDPTTPVTLTGNVGTKVNVPTAPTVIGYTLEKVKFNGAEVPVGSQVTLLATNTLEYSYTKDSEIATTTVEYKSGETPVTPTTSVTLTGNVGSEVSVPAAPAVAGYHYVNATFNGKAVTPNSKVTLEKAN